MKRCVSCDKWLDRSAFSKATGRKDGLQCACRSCNAKYRAENRPRILVRLKSYYAQNGEEVRSSIRSYRAANSDMMRQRDRQYYVVHRDTKRARAKNYRLENNDKIRLKEKEARAKIPHLEIEKARRREISKLQRTPSWADSKKMAEFYSEARRLTRETGIAHHVDHIVPLRGKLVSGLHWEANLQVITRQENLTKRNHFPVLQEAA